MSPPDENGKATERTEIPEHMAPCIEKLPELYEIPKTAR
jgi:hypothetical protein